VWEWDFGFFISNPKNRVSLLLASSIWPFTPSSFPLSGQKLFCLADIIGSALALGHGFGRIGCFTAGCCYGRACGMPWGVSFHSEYAHNLTGIPIYSFLHPTQLYESGLNFLNFFILFIILKRKSFDGQVFSLYVINYSILRYFVEFYRGDHSARAFLIQNPSPYLSLSFPQLFCLLGVVGGLILYFFLKKRKSA
jgi:phosphatidylglycerol:prolipoprotein diacylglycerol transferase